MTYNFETHDDLIAHIKEASKDETRSMIFNLDDKDYDIIKSMNLDPENEALILTILDYRTQIELKITRKLEK